MHDLAVVTKITKIEPIKDKDRIVLATVEGFNSIIQKNEFNVGSECVYVFYDSILPEKPEFEFLRKRCWSEKYKGFRIRPMKMGGVVSEGLILPMSVLPPGNYKQGEVVTDKLNIRLYDPEVEEEVFKKKTPRQKFEHFCKSFPLRRFKWYRDWMNKLFAREKKAYKDWFPKSDEENIERIFDEVKENFNDRDFIVSEKMEGQAAVYEYIRKRNVLNCYSHSCYTIDGNWANYAKQNDIKNKLKAYCKKHNLKEIAISGELCGPGIQKNIYKFDSIKLFLYGAYLKDGHVFTWDELKELSNEIGIPTVPYLETRKLPNTLEEIVKYSEGKSIVNSSVPREGVVWRTNEWDCHFKNKSREYKVWWDK